jgi:hypothetical protein
MGGRTAPGERHPVTAMAARLPVTAAEAPPVAGRAGAGAAHEPGAGDPRPRRRCHPRRAGVATKMA